MSESTYVVLDITGGALSPEEKARHGMYQDTDPDAPYYDGADR